MIPVLPVGGWLVSREELTNSYMSGKLEYQ